MEPNLGPTHIFWNVIGPAEAPRYGSSASAGLEMREPRDGLVPGRTPKYSQSPADTPLAAEELIGILGEANRIAARCQALFSKLRESSGLTGIETLTLIAISQAESALTVPQVGRSLGHPRQVIQRAVRVLEEAGLVAARPNPDHKRAPLLEATAQGLALGSQIDAAAQEVVSGLAGGMDAGTLGAAHAGLLALRRHIDARLGIETG